MTEPLYRIGEAARLLELETYVLRFWETEFAQLEPLRTPKGQRMYTAGHLDLLRRVKALLYEDGLTIDGARKALARESSPVLEGSNRVSEAKNTHKADKTKPHARKPHQIPQPNPVPPLAGETASRQLLQELHTELSALKELLREPRESPVPPLPTFNTSKETSP